MDARSKRGISSAGRAPALQAGGRRFDPVILHHYLFAVDERVTRFIIQRAKVPEGL
jgi:hypothetical protein